LIGSVKEGYFMKKRAYLLLLLVFIMSFSHAQIATAATWPSPIFGHKFTNGVGNYGYNNQYYFVDPA